VRSKQRLAGAGAVVIAIAALGVGSSAGKPAAQSSSRWEVTAKVTNGSQLLTRISDSSTPGHKGNGDIDSTWNAKWRMKVKIIGPDAYIVGANAFHVAGSASGEYRGSYPLSETATAHYTCKFSLSNAAKVVTKLRIYGNGRTDGKVFVNIGVHDEPGVLPPLKCTGDKLDSGVPKTFSAGVLTGIETVCLHDPIFLGVKLTRRKEFSVRKKFGWDPPSPSGLSRPCSGFGAPIRSAGFGTIKLHFDPVQ